MFSKLLRPGLSGACKHIPKLTRQYKNIIRTKHSSRFPRKPNISCVKNGLTLLLTGGYSLAWMSPLQMIRERKPVSDKPLYDPDPERLANIPKEVFKKDTVKKQPKRYFITKILIKIWQTIRLAWRICRITIRFMPIIILYPTTYISQGVTDFWYRWFIQSVENSGPAFIKFGQWASTRRDIFSVQFCEKFGKLFRRVTPHSWLYTKKTFERAFGKRWRTILVKFDNNRKPVGSGCIAQVYHAYMKEDMIPDESLLEEIHNEVLDDDDDTPDFFEGLEVLGFGALYGNRDQDLDKQEAELKSAAQSRREAREAEQLSQSEGSQDETTKDSSSIVDVRPKKHQTDNDDLEGLIPVAVKVLHPGVYSTVNRDLKILRFLAQSLEFIVPSLRWLSLKDCVEEFADLMKRQIDLRYEADCLEQFITNFSDVPCVRFPLPIRPYCKRDVMIETFEEGPHISEFVEGGIGDVSDDSTELDTSDLVGPNTIQNKLADVVVDTLLKMVFLDNLVHGDLHPGNILVQNADVYTPEDDNKLVILDLGDTVMINVKSVECPLRLILVDAGITSSLSKSDLQNFREVFTAVVQGNGEKVAELFLTNTKCVECKDIECFKSEMADLVNTARASTISLGQIQVGVLLSDVFSLLRRHRIKMESQFASVMLAIFVLEGLGRSLDPDLDILEKAKPILLESAMRY
ncbi:unnamed protein product [Owenia fusiformis]|uniref:ABC1 atypical kinase-like domain-containing protein n=1 Tax=Owenia fusiformis TaxID=6347 RepID=A0A8J1TIN2_OWEFU|nr:unnamed protein product [Owenia fusiformis]